MKSIFIGLFTIVHLVSFAGGTKTVVPYTIESDTISAKVPSNLCLVEGVVDYYGTGLEGALISTIDKKFQTKTDSSGHFSMLIPKQKTKLYMFKRFYDEIIIEPYDFKGRHKVIIRFNTIGSMDIVDKPVIYLYPTTKTKVNVSIEPKGELTFTYPKYKESWNITALPNGDLLDHNGRTYPYLFWEAQQKGIQYQNIKDGRIPGFGIKTDTVITFLENQLTQIGLNQKEKTDFITFWGPRIQQSSYALVQFILDEDYHNTIGSLDITPQPESIKRVFLIFTGLPKHYLPQTSQQHFTPFERKGFTVVEWGGTQLYTTVNLNL